MKRKISNTKQRARNRQLTQTKKNRKNSNVGKGLDKVKIGEGGYGCIHRPQLDCKNAINKSLPSNISKLLKSRHAFEELGEFAKINKIDPNNKYHLQQPELCDIDRNQSNVSAIKTCDIGKEVMSNLDDYKLLIMPFGGDNWKEFANQSKAQDIIPFWKSAINIFQAIHDLQANKYVHIDIKPHNILYNKEIKKSWLIDFGKLQDAPEILKECEMSAFDEAVFHFNYPIEYHLLNKTDFFDLMNKHTDKQIVAMYHEYFSVITTNKDLAKKDKSLNERLKNMSNFFHYVLVPDEPNQPVANFEKDFLTGILDLKKKWDQNNAAANKEEIYRHFIQKSIDTTDIYGFGFACKYVLTRTKHLTNSSLYEKLIMCLIK